MIVPPLNGVSTVAMLSIIASHQNIARFQVSMNDAFLVRMLHSLADVEKLFHTLLHGQPLHIAVPIKGYAVDELHSNERSAVRNGSRVQHFRNVGMLHHRQRMALTLKPG